MNRAERRRAKKHGGNDVKKIVCDLCGLDLWESYQRTKKIRALQFEPGDVAFFCEDCFMNLRSENPDISDEHFEI